MTAARAAVAAVAVLVIAWLAVMERDAALEARAAPAQQPGASAAVLARAEGDLRDALFLNPDSAPQISLAAVLRARGDEAGALAEMAGVVRREPDNLRAWLAYALLAEGTDPAAVERARAELRRLDPLNAR